MWRNQSGITLRSRHETSKRGRESGEADGRGAGGHGCEGLPSPEHCGKRFLSTFSLRPQGNHGKDPLFPLCNEEWTRRGA